jgi:hypothetical protein
VPLVDAEPCTLAIVRRRYVPTPSPGSTLIDAVTYFSWLLRVGATGILPVYAAVGVAGAVFAARTCGSAVDRYLAPLLVVVVTAAAEVTEFYGQHGIFRWAPYVMRCATTPRDCLT